MVPRPPQKNCCQINESQWDSETLKKSTQENYIRMRTPQEGFIGVDLNVLRLKFFRTPKIADHGPISGVVQKELSPLQVFQAFKVFCVFECQRYAIKMSNCYQISYVIKYYELRLGKALTKLLGWQALGCGSRSWAMRSQDSQRQCPTAVTHAFHDDFDENWPTLHSFSRRSME